VVEIGVGVCPWSARQVVWRDKKSAILRRTFRSPFSFPFLPPFAGSFIDDMGIGGQAKQLLDQGMKKPNTNTHKVSSTQTVIKAKRIKLGVVGSFGIANLQKR